MGSRGIKGLKKKGLIIERDLLGKYTWKGAIKSGSIEIAMSTEQSFETEKECIDNFLYTIAYCSALFKMEFTITTRKKPNNI